MPHSLVTAVIPTYNYGHYVTEAVESALAQTYSPLEVIVVDDGSTDDTRARLAPYMDRIRYIYQDNQGLSAARNTGIRHARGEWIALLDSDDLWHPQKTEVQLRAISGNEGVAMVGSPSGGPMPEVLDENPLVRPLGVADFLTSTPIGPSATIVRRASFDSVGMFDTSLRSVEDRDMWLRIAARSSALQVCCPCWWYRPHEGQMSRNAGRMYANYRRVLAKFFKAHPEHASLRRLAYAQLYLDSANCYFDDGSRGKAIGFILRSVCCQPTALPRRRKRGSWLRMKLLAKFILGDRSFQQMKKLSGTSNP